MGSVCINDSSSNRKDLPYPIIHKQLKMSPNRQCALEKPSTHFELIEDAQDLTQLESILEDLDINNELDDLKMTNEQIKIQKVYQEQVRTNQIVQYVSQNFNRIVTQTKVTIEQQESTSVIMKIKQGGQDSQTIKSILKSNLSKSTKTFNRIKQIATQKKVSFESRILKQKNNKLFA